LTVGIRRSARLLLGGLPDAFFDFALDLAIRKSEMPPQLKIAVAFRYKVGPSCVGDSCASSVDISGA
jgi:hypothetical protein